MKKLSKYLLVFICMFIFFISVKADDTITYSCDYYTGNGFKFRIKVSNLPKEYLTSPQKIDNESKVKKYVVFYYWDGSKYVSTDKTVSKNKSGINEKVGFFSGDLSSSLPNHTNQVQKFIINSTLDATSIKCPSLYSFEGGTIGQELYITTETSRTYTDDYGQTQTAGNVPATLTSMNCYKDGSPYQCSKIETGALVKEGTRECTYTANGSNRFKLIYDQNQNTVTFDKMGSGLVLSGDEPGTRVGNNYLLNNSELLSVFSSSSACPKNIKCSCNSLGTGCSFYRSKTNENCGQLVGEDGKDDDIKYGGESGDGGKSKSGTSPGAVNPDFASHESCSSLLGENLTKIVKAGIRIIQIAAAIIAIVNGMIILIPAVMAKDADGLKAASKKLVLMAIILAAVFLFPTLLRLIGNIFKFDISCIV